MSMKIDEKSCPSTATDRFAKKGDDHSDSRKRSFSNSAGLNGLVITDQRHLASKRVCLEHNADSHKEELSSAQQPRSAKQLIGDALRQQFVKSSRNGGWTTSDQRFESECDRRLASGVSRLATYHIELVRSKKSDGSTALAELRARYTNLANYGHSNGKVTVNGESDSKSSHTKTQETYNSVDRNPIIKVGNFIVEPSWPRPIRVGCGLNNLVNTCYLNSVLQVLSYTAPLVNFMRSHHAPGTCRAPSNRVCMLCVLRQHVNNVHNSSRGSISPTPFISNLKSVARHFRHNSQEDAHEYLRLLLDRLQQDASGLNGMKGNNSNNNKPNPNGVTAIYGGTLRSQVVCKSCSHVSAVLDPFLDLSLDIRLASRLDDALERFFAPELLRGANAYRCERCKQKVEASKRFKLQSLPVILTVHLKRFSPFSFAKLNKPISYPDTLNLSDYRHRDNEKSSSSVNAVYKLYAVIAHLGNTPNSGHYVAYARTAIDSPQWYCFDDSRVSSVSRHSALNNPNAYVLFYAKLFNNNSSSSSSNNDVKSAAVGHTPSPVKTKEKEASAVRINLFGQKVAAASVAASDGGNKFVMAAQNREKIMKEGLVLHGQHLNASPLLGSQTSKEPANLQKTPLSTVGSNRLLQNGHHRTNDSATNSVKTTDSSSVGLSNGVGNESSAKHNGLTPAGVTVSEKSVKSKPEASGLQSASSTVTPVFNKSSQPAVRVSSLVSVNHTSEVSTPKHKINGFAEFNANGVSQTAKTVVNGYHVAKSSSVEILGGARFTKFIVNSKDGRSSFQNGVSTPKGNEVRLVSSALRLTKTLSKFGVLQGRKQASPTSTSHSSFNASAIELSRSKSNTPHEKHQGKRKIDHDRDQDVTPAKRSLITNGLGSGTYLGSVN